MGIDRSRHLCCADSLPTMQLFKYRVPADDAEIFDASSRRRALRAENYSKRILLSGLPLYLDKPGRAYNWTPLASVFPRWGDQLAPGESGSQKRRTRFGMQTTLNTQRSTLNTQWTASELEVGRWTLDIGRLPVRP